MSACSGTTWCLRVAEVTYNCFADEVEFVDIQTHCVLLDDLQAGLVVPGTYGLSQFNTFEIQTFNPECSQRKYKIALIDGTECQTVNEIGTPNEDCQCESTDSTPVSIEQLFKNWNQYANPNESSLSCTSVSCAPSSSSAVKIYNSSNSSYPYTPCSIDFTDFRPVWISLCDCDVNAYDNNTAALASFLSIQPNTEYNPASTRQFVAAWITEFNYNRLSNATWGGVSGKVGITKATFVDSCAFPQYPSYLGIAQGKSACALVYTRFNTNWKNEFWDLDTTNYLGVDDNDCVKCLSEQLSSVCSVAPSSSASCSSYEEDRCYRYVNTLYSQASAPIETRPTTSSGAWMDYWIEETCCSPLSSSSPSASSASPSDSSASPSASSASPSDSSASPSVSSESPSDSSASSSSLSGLFNYYKAYPCGYWEQNNCSMFWQIGGGIPLRIDQSLDSSALVSCAQSNGTTIEYKVSKVNGLGSYPEICFLLIKQTTLSTYYTPTLITGAFTGCNACDTSSSDISVASSSSISSSSDLVSSVSSIFSSSVSSSSTVSISSSISQSSSSTSRLPSMSPSDRCGYHHPDKVDITGVYRRDPAYNTNIWITQGDSFCYRFKVFNDGAAVDLSNYEISGHLKMLLSDTGSVASFTTDALSDSGINNVLEITLSADETTCLPVTELVYDIEIKHKVTQKVEKVLIGYFSVKPEVTRHASDCPASWSLLTERGYSSSSSMSATSSSSSSSAAPTDCDVCFSAYIYRTLNSTDNTYQFTVEVPTNDAAMLGVTHWEAELYLTDSRGITTLHEAELVENNITPSTALSGYEVIFPVGGGRYRFVDKAELNTGNIISAFSVPVPVSTFNSAYFKIRVFTASCSYGSDWLTITFNPALTETYGTICTSSSSSSA